MVIGLAAAVLLSPASGRPDALPSVALGSAGLLHVEKALAGFAAYLFVLVVLARAFAGDLPSEIRGLKYSVGETREGVVEGIAEVADEQAWLRRRLERVEALVPGELPSRLPADGKEEQHV